jgi:hypothetical protein
VMLPSPEVPIFPSVGRGFPWLLISSGVPGGVPSRLPWPPVNPCCSFPPDRSSSYASSLASSSPDRHGFRPSGFGRVSRHLGRRRSGLGLRPASRSRKKASLRTKPSENSAFSCLAQRVDGEDKTPEQQKSYR